MSKKMAKTRTTRKMRTAAAQVMELMQQNFLSGRAAPTDVLMLLLWC